MPISEDAWDGVEGVVGVIQRDGRYLVIRRAAGVRVPNTWCFPGGAIEEGETQEEALVREMQEELGVRCRPVEPCWDWRREDGKLRLYLWRAEMIDTDLAPNPAEVAEVIWANREDILALPALLPSMRLFFEEVDKAGG